jgi:hypothetical protein
MPFRLVSSGGANVEPTMIEVLASGAVTIGRLVSFRGTAGGSAAQRYITEVTSPTAINLFAIAVDAVTSGTKYINVIPITGAQIWEADCTASTAMDQLYKQNACGDAGYVSNSSASGTATVGGTSVWTNLRYVGATTDKRMIGKFVNPNNLGDV